MKFLFIFVFLSSSVFADSLREQLNNRDIRRNQKLHQGTSNLRENFELESNPLETYQRPSRGEEIPVQQMPQHIPNKQNVPQEMMDTKYQTLTPEQAVELGKALMRERNNQQKRQNN